MTQTQIDSFVKRLVESGTEGRFTLLSGKKYLKKLTTIQKSMKTSVLVKNNTCGHRYSITIADFIANNKVCKRCLSSQTTVGCDSLHNTQTI